MSGKPILFSAPMVRALLSGRKTQTRRILNPQPDVFPVDAAGTLCDVYPIHAEGEPAPRVALGSNGSGVITVQKLSYAKGDRLWVREGLTADSNDQGARWITFTADRLLPAAGLIEWRYNRDKLPSIFMPRWASRITLEVTEVRIERLQNISEADAIAEGIEIADPAAPAFGWRCYLTEPKQQDAWSDPRESYRTLWNSINGAEAWDQNPWVAAYTFTVMQRNIDGVQS